MKKYLLHEWKANFLNIQSESEVAQLCPTLCNPVAFTPPGSSVHGILQARIPEWVAISFSRGSSRPRDRTLVSHIAGRCFNLWATRELSQINKINIFSRKLNKGYKQSTYWTINAEMANKYIKHNTQHNAQLHLPLKTYKFNTTCTRLA